MNGAVAERLGQRVVDQPVLLEQRQPVETRARDGDLEVVTAAGAVLDAQLRRVGKRVFPPGNSSMVISRGSEMNAGPLGSLTAICSRRLIIRPGLSCISRRWSTLVYWRTISPWSRGSCSH